MKIIKAGSQWQTFGSQTMAGHTYYNVGGSQWVRSDYGSWRTMN